MTMTTSLEQVALVSLIHTLLQSPDASPLLGATLAPPYTAEDDSEAAPAPFPPSFVAPSILYKLLRFLVSFSSETSAHLDVLRSINLVLSTVQLNQLAIMRDYTPKVLPSLINLWSKTRSKDVREQILIGCRLLLPFVQSRTARGNGPIDDEQSDLQRRLLETLDGADGETTKGGELLSMDSLRLRVERNDAGALSGRRTAFVGGSFMFGETFPPSQATVWATLELQADLIASLAGRGEEASFVARSQASSPAGTKRRKVEDPLTALLRSIEMAFHAPSLVAKLQLLLFLVDRHWRTIRSSARAVLEAVSTSLNWEDPSVQSWALLCLAAIATEDRPFRPPPTEEWTSTAPSAVPNHVSRSPFASPSRKAGRASADNSLWDKAWTFAARKAIIPAVCRAACHAAHAIAVAEKVAPLVILTDVESLVRDIEIQGPSFPYDSVCAFLATTMEMASRDVRLFRMDLETKVINWLSSSWRVVDGTTKGFNVRTKLESHTPSDVLRLLSSACRFPRNVTLAYTYSLPESPIVAHVTLESKSAVVRDYIIHAQLDLPTISNDTSPQPSAHPTSLSAIASPGPNDNLVQLDGCARKLSTFLTKSANDLVAEWTDVDFETAVTAEKVRRSLDLVVLVLAFEAVLELNGVSPERKALKAACTLLAAIAPAFALARLTTAELAVMVQGLEPLVFDTDRSTSADQPGSRALLRPGIMTGIRKDMLPSLGDGNAVGRARDQATRLAVQHIIWKSSDVQDAFAPLLSLLRNVLTMAIGAKAPAGSSNGSGSMDVEDDDDGFGAMRVVEDDPSEATQSAAAHSGDASRLLVSTLVACITRVPSLETASTDPSRNKDVFSLLLSPDCEGPQFLALGTALFDAVQRGQLHLGKLAMSEIADAFAEWFESYRFSRDEEMHLLAIAFLRATVPVWTGPSMVDTDEGQRVLGLCLDLKRQLERGKMRSPHVRVAFVQFAEAYLRADPTEAFLSVSQGEDALSLVALIETVTRDVNVLVRFETAVVYPNLFNFVGPMVANASRMYGRGSTEFLPYVGFEHDLTTSLLFANVLIVSSSLRKAAYYHVLERPGAFPEASLVHLQAALTAAATTLGFGSLFRLWEAYCPAVAARVTNDINNNVDVVKMPACLLGYSSLKQNADMLLRRFGYMDLLLVGGEAGKERVAEIVRSTRPEGQIRAECLPRSLAILVSDLFAAHKDESEFDGFIAEYIPGAHKGTMIPDAIGSHLDEMIAALLSQLVDPSPEMVEEALLQLEDGQRMADVYRAMSQPLPQLFSPGALLPPRHVSTVIVMAYQWFHHHPAAQDVITESVIFNALHDLASRAGKSPLVIEQIRFVRSIALLVSLHYSFFDTPFLLATLLHLSIVLMGQTDLAPVVAGLLRWALDQSVKLKTPPKGVSEFFVRIAHLAHSFVDSMQTEVLRQLGEQLLAQLEHVLEQTVDRSDEWRGEARKTLLLWPRPLKDALALHCANADVADLDTVLSDRTLSSAKFSLAKRYRDALPDIKPDERSAFASSSLWHLKSALPSTAELAHRPEEMEAFMDLLYLVDGALPAPSLDTLVSLAAADNLLGPDAVRARGLPRTSSTRFCVAVGLAELLRASDIGVIDVAFQTLRLLQSIPNSSIPYAKVPVGDIKDRLTYIGRSAGSLAQGSGRSLNEIGKAAPAMPHNEWLGKIAPFLADILAHEDAFFAQLTPVFAASATFTHRLLPHLVHAVLQLPEANPGASAGHHKAVLSSYLTSLLRSPSSTTVIKRSILDVVLHLRHFQPDKPDPASVAHEQWLEIDYLLLSQAAVQCRAYTTALLFLELRGKKDASEESEDVSQLLYEVYSNIEDPDGFYGVNSTDVRTSLVRRLHHEHQWARAFTFHGAAFQTDSRQNETRSAAVGDVLESLHSFGFDKMAMAFLQGSRSSKGADEDVPQALSYELAWRTDAWDVPAETTTSVGAASGSALFSVLKAVHRERDPLVVARTLEGAVLSELSRMRALSTESMTELREIKSSLLCLREVKLWTLGGTREAIQSFRDVASDQLPFDKLVDAFEFADTEKITAVRHSLLRSPDLAVGIQGQTSPAVAQIQKTCHLQLSAAARNAGQLQIAVNATTLAQQIEGGIESSSAVSSEFASVLWLEKEHGLAIRLLQQTVEEQRRPSKSAASKTSKDALHLSLLGEWTSLSRTDTPERIRERFFDPAEKILESQQPKVAEFALVYHRFATFAEQQYRAHDQSKDIDRIRQYKAKTDREQELAEEAGHRLSRGRSRVSQGDSTASSTTADNIQKQRGADLATLATHDKAMAYYLETAIGMYAQTLSVSNEFDSTVVNRLSSLWLSHYDDDELNSHIGGHLQTVPSHKFVALIYQLSGRLDEPKEASEFQKVLQPLLYRLGKEHPFHCVYQLITLRDAHIHAPNLSKARQSSSHSRKSTGGGVAADGPTGRGRAALAVLHRIAKSSSKTAQRLKNLDTYCAAAIAWCNWDARPLNKLLAKKKGGQAPQIEPTQPISRLQDLDIPVPTATLPVDPSAQYKTFVRIKRVSSSFSLAGGIHLPKITTMYGSDGRSYKQLYKGGDDVRQDAIMQQLFEVVNTLLHADTKTRSRSLLVRTYKILPLAAETGVIEFVGNTVPLGGWLNPAHQKYNPSDMTSKEFGAGMQAARDAPRHTPETIKAKWLDQLRRWHPVFRHYFTDSHKDPMSWFAMRLNYARSVATTSVVGHMVGLGDRHLSNILLDQGTGEVVHIDLGIAFGQGRELPIPELVPFRLTPDLIDGLGISGVEGVFRRGAEETLRVLRDQSETIMTVLAVFRYDPLQKWITDADKLARIQAEAFPPTTTAHGDLHLHTAREEATDELADRALAAVREKLDTRLSIEYTVNDLIVQATDPGHLSAIYRGWQSHC